MIATAQPTVSPKDIRRMVISGITKGLRSEQISLREYIREGWKVIEPAKPMIEAYYIDLIAEYLEAVTHGEITRLIFNIPPRHGKSNLVTILWPTWDWSARPWRRFICASYSQRLSDRHSLARRRLIQSPWYQRNWGEIVQIRDDQDQKREFENSNRGLMMATSVGGTVTGTGGDVLISDDIMNPKQAESEAFRETALDFFDQTLRSRLDDKRKGAMVVVEQRLHTKDLTGHLLEEGGWEHVCLPGIAERKTIIDFPSGRTVIRKPGDVLSPKRESRHEIEKQKRMGTRAFQAQVQQNPSSEEGATFKRGWWKYWKKLPAQMETMILSWDMSFKDTDGSDYVVGQVWGYSDGRFYLVDQVRDRMDYPTSRVAVKTQHYKWPEAYAKLIEEKANGAAIISDLKTQVPGLLPITPKESKQARAAAVAPYVEAGNVFIPDPSIAPWINDYVEELAAFPLGDHDDQVDASSQALAWLADRAARRPAAAMLGGLQTSDSLRRSRRADWM